MTSTLATPTRVDFDGLRHRVTGAVAEQGTPAYDALVTPWNVAVPVRPAAVLAAESAQDVVEAVRFATHHRLAVTPQATGHGAVEGLVGELVVATSGLDELVVHPEGWARVGAGVKWGRVVEAAAHHGLAPLNGSSTDVGVVGYTTGGGLGPMARTYGLASDRVRAFEVVTGDAVLRRVTPTEHPELFFALRGGKGALGIVTAIEFDLVRQPTFFGGAAYFDGSDAAAVLERWRTWSAELPEQATTSFALLQLPPLEMVPPELAGRLTVAIRYVWTGDAEQGRALLAPMLEVATPLLLGIAEMPYPAIDMVHADPVDPMPVHEGAALLTDLPVDALDALLHVAGEGSGSPLVIVEVRQLGGATGRAPEHPDAFCHRAAGYSLLTIGIAGMPGAADHGAAVLATMAPWSTGGLMPNFAATADGAEQRYDEPTLARLRAAIRTYDPQGVMAVGRALRT